MFCLLVIAKFCLFFCFSSIDATNFPLHLGRYVNDSSKPNCVIKLIQVDDTPRLCLFALHDIQKNTELRYNYGDGQYEWRNKVSCILHVAGIRGSPSTRRNA